LRGCCAHARLGIQVRARNEVATRQEPRVRGAAADSAIGSPLPPESETAGRRGVRVPADAPRFVRPISSGILVFRVYLRTRWWRRRRQKSRPSREGWLSAPFAGPPLRSRHGATAATSPWHDRPADPLKTAMVIWPAKRQSGSPEAAGRNA
jgi:hypothetical protein